MAKVFSELASSHQDFIQKQQLFFVATAPLMPDGHVNLSPKGLDTFQILSSTPFSAPERIKFSQHRHLARFDQRRTL
ncbi:MAG: pyridoxamine 5'-phosphate oxidase family protein, partial [Cyanobacteria bacterium J06636_28]